VGGYSRCFFRRRRPENWERVRSTTSSCSTTSPSSGPFRRGCRGRCCATGRRASKPAPAACGIGSTGSRCCIASRSPTGACPTPTDFLRTKAFAAAAEGRVGYREFASDPCRKLFSRVSSLFVQSDISDNAVVNLTRGSAIASSQCRRRRCRHLRPDDAGDAGRRRAPARPAADRPPPRRPSQRRSDQRGCPSGSGQQLPALHPCGERRGADTDDDRRQPTRLPAQLRADERFIVLTLGPLTVDPPALALSRRPFIENYRWRPRQGTRFIAVERATGRLAKRWEADPIFLFHHINAFEDGGDIVVDLCAYRDAAVIDDLYLDRLRSTHPSPTRGRTATACRCQAVMSARNCWPTSSSSCRA